MTVESAWFSELIHVDTCFLVVCCFCFDSLFYFYFVCERRKPRRSHPLQWNAISCTCPRIIICLFYFWEQTGWESEESTFDFIGIRSSGKDLDELYLCLCHVCFMFEILLGHWFDASQLRDSWKGVILAYLTYTMSVSWPMLKGFSTRVRGLLSRFVMSDSAEALSMPKGPEPDMASGTMEGTPGSLGTEVFAASPVRAEGEKGDHKGKRTLDTVPEVFAEEPSEKRRKEQELAYNTLK